MKIFLGIGFYGAGNIGEDLMIAGFLKTISRLGLSYDSIICAIHYNLRSQQLRFPEIDWHTKGLKAQRELISNCDVWICVGDTPFQTTSGLEFLKNLEHETSVCEKEGKPIFMVGVGAEREAERYKHEFHDVIKKIKVIATRDQATVDIIKHNLGCKDANAVAFADLANISLQHIFDQTQDTEKTYDLGWTVNTDSIEENDIHVIKSFINSLRNSKKVFVCNEVRKLKSMERSVYRKYFKSWYYPWNTSNQVLSVPKYSSASLQDLVSVYSKCKKLITTRYHGLLIAAWAGCAVGAIARSSKVENLAKVLGVPYAKKPLKSSELQEVYNHATKVSRSKLDALAQKASDGVKYLWEYGLNDL